MKVERSFTYLRNRKITSAVVKQRVTGAAVQSEDTEAREVRPGKGTRTWLFCVQWEDTEKF